MHAQILLALPFLLPLTSALPRSSTSNDIRGLGERKFANHGIMRPKGHVQAKRAYDDRAIYEDTQRMVRRKIQKKRACVPKSNTNSTSSSTTPASTSTTAIGDVNAAKPKTTSATTTTQAAVTTTTSASAGSTAGSGSSGGGGGSMMDWLFPVTGQNWWTTYTGYSSPLSINGAIKPLTAGKMPTEANAPDGSDSLVAYYPANTYGINTGNNQGFSFYSEGSQNGVNVEGAKEVLMSYSVFFPSGFDFVKGGKMPGLYGGSSLAEAKSCSGGRQTGRETCFSARLMWRTNGAGEFYNYYPTSVQQGNGYCQTAPYSICDTTYGDSIGRGSFSWATGSWTTVAQRVKLNDVGSANGEQQLWVNGQPIMHLTGLQIITQPGHIYGIMAQTFFGGSDSSWNSPKDQSAYFKDWSLAVLS